MSISTPFIHRPVATTLLTAAIALAGIIAFIMLPVAPLPQIDFPTINVQAGLPGASPEIMASSVATPLERQFGRIAGVTEMTSSSYLGTTRITLQFDLNRNIDGAARDVQAAINAARSYLPANLPSNPTYRKSNPADPSIFQIALTSDIYDRGKLYDAASTIMQQKLSEVNGVGEVFVGGSSLPAVRVELNPTQLNAYGLGLQDVRNMLSVQNANLPKGQIWDNDKTVDVLSNDQLLKADYYKPLIVGYHNGAAVKLSDVADVEDSVENVRAAAYFNGKPCITVQVFRQPGANIMDTVDRIRQALPVLKASIPAGIDLAVTMDRTVTIRASVHEIERTLLISIGLVILVVFVFLRNPRATLIPSVAVPVSLIGTFGVMYLWGFSIDNLSLMALTISTGFVVDDAIVVIENISRHVEAGMRPLEAALHGASEIGFTVLSMTLSLVAVFIPILMMAGIVGRLFREFAITLSVAILVSLLVSLTMTPMMSARLLKREHDAQHGWIYRVNERSFNWLHRTYEKALHWVLEHEAFTLGILLITIAVNVYLLIIVPKGFFPLQDNGTLGGGIRGSQDISFQTMDGLSRRFVNIIKSDPAVDTAVIYTGGNGPVNGGFVSVTLKPLAERKLTSSQVIDRLRPKLVALPGARAILQAGQDLRIGGRQSNAQYQYTLQSEDVDDLVTWAPVLVDKMRKIPQLTDVDSDQQNSGLQARLVYDRATAARLGITPQLLDTTLYNAFGQSQVSTMYTTLNQYHVVMEVAPQYWQNPQGLNYIYIKSTNGGVVPLGAVAHFEQKVAPLAVNHQGQFPSVTVSFNLAPGVALSDADAVIKQAEADIGLPSSIHGMYSGTLQAFQASLATEPLLITTALLAVYIVLGMLYESYIHPITILSTLPSAGVGAVLALMIFHKDLSVIALIGIILLIGLVKKNAILMIDFALAAQRNEHKSPKEAIFEACLLRFRPILMTTMAALLGALPLALGTGTGSELRNPLGITIIGGLIFSQMLTLFTTPVVYLYMDRLGSWREHVHQRQLRVAPQAGD
ncbi:MAG TPA: multidrug efflux RND transporter permease subunit [Candidatus Acidoferrales bacterium]|jgi:multidrug efflux pump|nr:multidrug efflux RND transporter permease subunit [Candidatus Acidoferrales bacterium]